MHITLETDYAIRIVDCLAREKNRIGASAIAEQSHVTLRFSLKILRKLVASGIVRSYKGATGGYVLAKDPHEITVGDILETIEGQYLISRCLRDGHICTRVKEGDFCPYHHLFMEISDVVQKKFTSATIGQMLQRC